jgi:hypothetical protein
LVSFFIFNSYLYSFILSDFYTHKHTLSHYLSISLSLSHIHIYTKLIQTLYNLQIDTNKENLLANNTDSDDEIIATENTSLSVDKTIKYLFYKPFNEHYSIEKMLEYHFI